MVLKFHSVLLGGWAENVINLGGCCGGSDENISSLHGWGVGGQGFCFNFL